MSDLANKSIAATFKYLVQLPVDVVDSSTTYLQSGDGDELPLGFSSSGTFVKNTAGKFFSILKLDGSPGFVVDSDGLLTTALGITQAAGNSSTQLATTAFVGGEFVVAAPVSFVSDALVFVSDLRSNVRTRTLTANATFTATGMSAGRSMLLRVNAGASTRTVSWPAGWVVVGSPLPTSLPAGSTTVVRLVCFGPTEAEVTAEVVSSTGNDASTLTGTTLAATVVASSLTSVGTLTGGATGTGFTIALGTSTVTGTLAPARMGSGTPSAATFLRGDGAWTSTLAGGLTLQTGTATRAFLSLGDTTARMILGEAALASSVNYCQAATNGFDLLFASRSASVSGSVILHTCNVGVTTTPQARLTVDPDGIVSVAQQLRAFAGTAATPPLAVFGAAAQTAPLVSLAQRASDGQHYQAGSLNATWSVSTVATRTGQVTLAANYIGTAQTGLTITAQASGTPAIAVGGQLTVATGGLVLSGSNSAVYLENSGVIFGKDAGGTYRTVLSVYGSSNHVSLSNQAATGNVFVGTTNVANTTGQISFTAAGANVGSVTSAGAWTFTGSVTSTGTVKTQSTTVAALTAAATAGAGARSFVTDATATTFASVVAGGGANKVPVCSDGVNWIIA